MRIATALLLSGVAGLALVPSIALAQQGAPLAPAAGSPPGQQYQIPLESGRDDAAPKRGAQDQGDQGGSSSYRSENNFGSSSVVPGDPRGTQASDANGTGDASTDASADASAASFDPDASADTGNTSDVATFGMLALILLLGALVGNAGVPRMRQ